LIPDTVFDLSLVDPLAPPVYVATCAASTQIDLASINLSMPPAPLIQCMKLELRDFLIDNSFVHQLDHEPVPMYLVHGSGDTLVPYQQAMRLCAAVGNSLLIASEFGSLTTYDCGKFSKLRVIEDAEHALELGVCLGSVCPAGEPGSETFDAVTTALHDAYAWLAQDVYWVDGPGVGSQPSKDVSMPPWYSGGSRIDEDRSTTAAGTVDWLTLALLLLLRLRKRSPWRVFEADS
jgi:hypothetical protein